MQFWNAVLDCWVSLFDFIWGVLYRDCLLVGSGNSGGGDWLLGFIKWAVAIFGLITCH